MFLFPLLVMYGEAMVHFYKNCRVLDDGTMSVEVKGVELVLAAKLLVEILKVPMEGFDTYVTHEWPELGGTKDTMYLTSKYTQEREKLIARKVRTGKMKLVHKLLFKFLNKCLLPRSERRHEVTYLDLAVIKILEKNILPLF